MLINVVTENDLLINMPFETHYSRFSPPRPQDTTGEVRNPASRRNLWKQLTKPEKNEEECGGLAD